MRILLVLAAVMMTASAEAKVISVQCKAQHMKDGPKNLSVVFSVEPGQKNLISSLEFNKTNLMLHSDQKTPDTRRNEGLGLMVEADKKSMMIAIAEDLDAQYPPYDQSTFEVRLTECGNKTENAGVYKEAKYRSGLNKYDLSCTCEVK